MISQGLGRLALAGLGWSYGCTAARVGVQFGTGLVLARLLEPHAFGMVAAAWALVGMGSQFLDLGFGAALVQKREITDHDVRCAFTMQLTLGAVCAAGFALFAPVLARGLHEDGLVPVIRWLCLALFAQACGQTSHALLRRKLDFKTAQLAQTTGAVLGSVFVALPLAAFTSFQVLSLAAGQATQIAVSSALAYRAVRHSLIPAWRPEPGLARFGLKVTATNMSNWLMASLDSLLMSRAFGATAVGFYNRAQSAATTPASSLVQVLQSVLFPAYSRSRDNPAAAGQVYLASLAAALLVILPAAAVGLTAPRTIVTALFGESWAPAAPLFAALACAMPWQAVAALSGPLLWARDEVGREFKIQASTLLVFAPALGLASTHSPAAMAWCVTGMSMVRATAMSAYVGVPPARLLAALRAPLLLSLIAGAAAFAGDRLLNAGLTGVALCVAAGLSAGALLLRGLVPVELRAYRTVLAGGAPR